MAGCSTSESFCWHGGSGHVDCLDQLASDDFLVVSNNVRAHREAQAAVGGSFGMGKIAKFVTQVPIDFLQVEWDRIIDCVTYSLAGKLLGDSIAVVHQDCVLMEDRQGAVLVL